MPHIGFVLNWDGFALVLIADDRCAGTSADEQPLATQLHGVARQQLVGNRGEDRFLDVFIGMCYEHQKARSPYCWMALKPSQVSWCETVRYG